MRGLKDAFMVCLEVYYFCEFCAEPRAIQYRADFERVIEQTGRQFKKPHRDLALFKRIHLEGLSIRQATREVGVPLNTGVNQNSKNISVVGMALITNHLFPPSGYFEIGVNQNRHSKYETIKTV
jgi:hypothetical protein